MKFSAKLPGPDAECQLWADVLKPESAEVLATYTMGDHAGQAAITSNNFGKGRAIYIGARTDPAPLGRVLNICAAAAGIASPFEAPAGVEVATRQSGQQSWTFILNHTAKPQTVTPQRAFKDVGSGTAVSAAFTLEPYGVRVLQPVLSPY